MTERIRESLSATMDGEADELELERVLSKIGDDTELRRTWVRYHSIRSIASGQSVDEETFPDVSQRVREALAAEVRPAAAGSLQRVLKPLASFAVAASVAATVVIGGQQLAQINEGGEPREAVASAVVGVGSPVGLINSTGATPVRASYGNQAVPVLEPAARTAYRELARQRMHKYMQEHAEHAALNAPHGLIPFARVRQIEE
ncbi:MAG: sigma-E factor negative regulatory protein [Halieaceae bacterium]|jgi:sigma-E factor negative regulatory protein RseA|nr:sigma-E factor negative regulatory protein [Halieaceae bacterium]